MSKRSTLFVVSGVVVLGLVYFAIGATRYLQAFRVEDKIFHTYWPVTVAIEHYYQTNGVPPRALEQLVPSFIPSVPTSPYIYQLEYRVVGVTNFIMSGHSRTLEQPRIYTWRSDWAFSMEENARLIKQYHNIAVFRE